MVTRSALEAQLAACQHLLAESEEHVRFLQTMVDDWERALGQQQDELDAVLLRNAWLENRYRELIVEAEARARMRRRRREPEAKEG